MGGGSWTTDSFRTYTNKTKGVALDSFGVIDCSLSNQEMFKAKKIDQDLNPYKINRECLNTEEHPNTVPVILGLDVTGSMGDAAVEVAKKLNVIMTDLYDKKSDIEFMIMGIGDLACDAGPIQVSQFESDIRIAEHLDKVWFEFGGGGNYYESYTAAWYIGSRHCSLDCWKDGKKGIIITMGDERINPYLPKIALEKIVGDDLQGNIETKDLYSEASEKYDIYHLYVKHGRDYDEQHVVESWSEYLDDRHFRIVTLDSITNEIVDIILGSGENTDGNAEGISW